MDIKLERVVKSFGSATAVDHVDLHIKAGEFLTLVGPSGCGKSTLLRIIAGLESQTSGSVSIGGDTVDAVRPSERNLAMVFQSYALYPHLSVRENMMVPLRLRDLSAVERMPLLGNLFPSRATKMHAIRSKIDQAAETLQISHLLERKPGELSGGQRQRVAVGRAMVRQPTAFLMDEPLSNLDAALRVHMRTEISGLHRSLKTTFIYVTHDQAEALTMSSRMAVMMDGQILQVDTPERIYRNPADLRVAQFVGSPRMNIFPGEVDSLGRIQTLEFSLDNVASEPVQGNVSVGFRPEHLRIVNGSGGHDFTLKVTHKENLGADYFIHGAVADGNHQVIVRATPEEVTGVSIGDELGVGCSKPSSLVFGDSNKRIDLRPGLTQR